MPALQRLQDAGCQWQPKRHSLPAHVLDPSASAALPLLASVQGNVRLGSMFGSLRERLRSSEALSPEAAGLVSRGPSASARAAAAAGGGPLLGEKHSEKDLALDRWVFGSRCGIAGVGQRPSHPAEAAMQAVGARWNAAGVASLKHLPGLAAAAGRNHPNRAPFGAASPSPAAPRARVRPRRRMRSAACA